MRATVFTRHALRISLLLLLSLVLSRVAGAQRYPFVQVTASDTPAGCLFPFADSHGRLWLSGCETGTEGVFYFDGTRFVSPLKSGFPNAIVRGMAEDSEGGIWFSSTAGIYRLCNGKLEKIVSGVAEAGIEEIAPDVFLAAVGESANEATATADAVRIAKTNDGWKAQPIVTAITQVQFRLDASGHILFGCNGGYCELQRDEVLKWRGGSPVSVLRHSIHESNEYAHSAALVLRDHSGCVWLKTSRQAFYQCPTDALPVAVPNTLGYPMMLELPDGSIVIRGTTRITIGRPGRFRVITAQNGYPGNAFPVADKSGNLWLVCPKGLFYLPWRMGMEFWSQSEGLEGNTFSLLRLDGKLFAIAGESLEIFEANHQRWHVLASLGDIQHLTEGPDGTILAASPTRGALQISQDGKVLHRSLPANVSLIRRAQNGKLWAIGGSIWSVNVKGQDVRLQSEINGVAGVGLDLKFDPAGNPWACYGDGLRYREGSDWGSIAKAQGLPAERCASLVVDPQGDVWYADYILRSLFLIQQPKSGRPEIRQFHSGGEMGTALATFLETDHRGWLWRGSADGIYVADPGQAKQGEWLHLDVGDGLPARSATAHSFFEDSDGSVWYCADTSVIHFYPPNDLVHPQYAPSIFLSTFSSGGEATLAADSFSDAKSGTNLSVHVGSLQFDRRNLLRLRYRLLPEQQTWKTGRDLDLHLGKLPWGRHTLQVQGQLGNGPWSNPVEQSFTVLRPIWLSWPALMLIGAGGSAFGAGTLRWRKTQQLKRELQLPDLSSWRMSALSPETESLVGTTLADRYEIVHILSVGGFATVARARDQRESGAPCAVKIFRYELGDQAWIRHRFEQEVAALEQLSHPNIVQITGHGRHHTGAPYLVMEFIEGRSLRDLLDEGRLPRKRIVNILRQAVSALTALHDRSIYHRDLKPENFMIRVTKDDAEHLVLIDFSIAIVKSADQTFHGISRVAGTLGYMAPEQVIGFADASTDIHALAKIVTEMLTGTRWTDLLPEGTLQMADFLSGYLESHPCGLTRDSIAILSSALAFDPQRRPNDAARFGEPIIRDLENAS